MEQQKNVIIVPIQESLSDDAIEDALSEPIGRGYYLAFLLEHRGGNLRAVYKRSLTYVEPAEQAIQDAAKHAAKDAKDTEDNKARLIVASRPHLSQVRVMAVLSAAGIIRSCNWVGKQRALMAANGARVY